MKNEETVDYIASREGVCKMENFLACLYALKTQFTERIIDRGETENNLEQESKVKVLVTQSCPTLCDPMVCSPPRLLCPWNSPGKNTAVGCHFLLQGIYDMGWSSELRVSCGTPRLATSMKGVPGALC